MWDLSHVTEKISMTFLMDCDHEQREFIEKNRPELLNEKFAQIGFRFKR